MSAGPRVELSWTPHDAQREVLRSSARYRIISAGRRFGKTEMSVAEVFREAIEHPGTTAWWAAPTYSHTEVAWETFDEMVPNLLIADRKRTHPRQLQFVNDSRISFRSTEHRDNLRGPGLDALVLDEAAFIAPDVWSEVLRPTLADTGGWALFVSTPNGENWFHDLYQQGQSPDPEFEAYESWQFPTTANPHVPETEVAAAKREHPEHVFRQEWRAEFTENSGGVFSDVRGKCVEEYEWREYEGDPPFTLGVDLARTSAYTVIITLDADGVLTDFSRLRDVSWTRIQREIEAAAADAPGEVRIDATRDNKLVGDLEAAGVNVQPVRFTSESKRNLIENLEVRIDKHDLTLPEISPLLSELGAFERDVTDAGNVRYRAPTGFNDDCVDALALAAHQSQATGPQPKFHLPDRFGQYHRSNPT